MGCCEWFLFYFILFYRAAICWSYIKVDVGAKGPQVGEGEGGGGGGGGMGSDS